MTIVPNLTVVFKRIPLIIKKSEYLLGGPFDIRGKGLTKRFYKVCVLPFVVPF